MTTVNFYRDLPVLESFAQTIETARHAQVPGDWWIVVADVIGSTKAIEAGAYKKVNTVGVACIAAVVNVDRSVEMPFVFGGDGATFAVPDSLRRARDPGVARGPALVAGELRPVVACRPGPGFEPARQRPAGATGEDSLVAERYATDLLRDAAGKKPSAWSRTRWPTACCGFRKTRARARAASRVSNAVGRVCRAFRITSLRCWWRRCRTMPT